MGSTIIGIDHGYKNMKSANAMFATRLSRLDSKPDEMQMDGVVEFEGVYYTIYGSPLAAVNNHIKSESEEYYFLTLASLGEEFRARGIQPGPNKIHVRLGCGLPQKWYDSHPDSEADRRALEKAMANYEALEFEGIILYAGAGEAVGFSMGNRISGDTFDVNFEKAFADVQGAYPLVNREFARYIREKHPEIHYLNREDDMGLENLRKAKESYHPILLEKFIAREIV